MNLETELKLEEEKYRKLYNDHSRPNFILDGLRADAFKMAIYKLEKKGVIETYQFFKIKRDEFSSSWDKLGKNLGHAHGLVVSKLWKYYKKSKVKNES